jgi:hypothetical protein
MMVGTIANRLRIPPCKHRIIVKMLTIQENQMDMAVPTLSGFNGPDIVIPHTSLSLQPGEERINKAIPPLKHFPGGQTFRSPSREGDKLQSNIPRNHIIRNPANLSPYLALIGRSTPNLDRREGITPFFLIIEGYNPIHIIGPPSIIKVSQEVTRSTTVQVTMKDIRKAQLLKGKSLGTRAINLSYLEQVISSKVKPAIGESIIRAGILKKIIPVMGIK